MRRSLEAGDRTMVKAIARRAHTRGWAAADGRAAQSHDESVAAPHVTYSQGQVVDEGKRHGSDTPFTLERNLRGAFLNAGAADG